jgi:hypothetical protein
MDDLRLVERLKTTGFEASVITSFNVYFPFYETVVLPRLASSGSRLNSVLIDPRQLALTLSSPELRPRSAGHSYTLAPVHGADAFHPKVLIAGGPRKGLVAVGSHNLTLAGYGHNREVTTIVDVQGKGDSEAVAFARSAWAFVAAWIEAQRERLPDPVISAILKTAELIPWLRGRPSQGGLVEFIGTLPDGPCLWDQLQPRLSEGVSRATLVGPFFDRKLRFVERVVADLAMSELTIAIDPRTAEWPSEATLPPGVRVVDGTDLSRKSGYLHGKIGFFEMTSGRTVLVLGSANPSSPAWLGDPGRRNAEAVVVQAGEVASELAERMGITGLRELPELSREGWDSLRRPDVRNETDEPASTRTAYALESESGFEIKDSRLAGVDIRSVSVIPEGGSDRPSDGHHLSGGLLSVECPVELRKAVRFISVEAEAASVLALVHHTREIQARGQTSRQAQLRSALSSLGGHQPDLTNLIQLVERIIFDDDGSATIAVPRRGRAKKDREEDEDDSIGSLAATLEESKAKRRSRRRLVEGGSRTG